MFLHFLTRDYVEELGQFHTGVPAEFAHTPQGIEITRGLEELGNEYDLGLEYGNAPQDYHLTSDPFPSNSSLLSLFANEVGCHYVLLLDYRTLTHL